MARTWTAEVAIRARPEAVWAVLTDFDAYGAWNPFTPSVQTTGTVGEPVVMRVVLPPWGMRRQVETLLAVEPPHRLVWALDQPPRWLLWAERTQTLEPTSSGCLYRTEDAIGGVLWPLVALLMGHALSWGFPAMAQALRQHVEAHGASGSDGSSPTS